MKVVINEKPFLENGRHVVNITEVEEGKSENKQIPFINCRLENEKGFVPSVSISDPLLLFSSPYQ